MYLRLCTCVYSLCVWFCVCVSQNGNLKFAFFAGGLTFETKTVSRYCVVELRYTSSHDDDDDKMRRVRHTHTRNKRRKERSTFCFVIPTKRNKNTQDINPHTHSPAHSSSQTDTSSGETNAETLCLLCSQRFHHTTKNYKKTHRSKKLRKMFTNLEKILENAPEGWYGTTYPNDWRFVGPETFKSRIGKMLNGTSYVIF